MPSRRRPTIKSFLLLTATYATVVTTLPRTMQLADFADRPGLGALAILIGVLFWAIPFLLSWIVHSRAMVAIACGVIGMAVMFVGQGILRLVFRLIRANKKPTRDLLEAVVMLHCVMTPATSGCLFWNETNALDESLLYSLACFQAAQMIVYAFLGWLMAATFTSAAPQELAVPVNPIE
jgi:hypothetical protein